MITALLTTARGRQALVVAGWILAALTSGLAGAALADAETDEDLAFLPEGSRSAAFLAEHQREQRGQPPSETATVVVPTTDGADAAIVAEVRELARVIASDVASDPAVSRMTTSAPVVSPDEQLIAMDVELGARDDDEVAEMVARLRELCAEWSAASGMQSFVTGEAGVEADLISGNVDLWLLVCSVVVVAVILAAVYRSPTVWLLPVATGIIAVLVSRALALLLAQASIVVTELTTSIGTVVVFGICTDYALLLLNRVRRSQLPDRAAALRAACREVRQPVLVSAATIILAVLALTPSPIPGIAGLGPALAVGIACAAAASLTLLPALLGLLGVPVRPAAPRRGAWGGVAASVMSRRWVSLGGAAAVLGGCALMAFSWESSADPLANVRDEADSKHGAVLVREHFGDSSTSPLMVSFSAHAPARAVDALMEAADEEDLAVSVVDVEQVGDRAEIAVALEAPPYSPSWEAMADQVQALAAEIDPDVLVGGSAAEALEREQAVWSQLLRFAPLLVAALLVALWVWLGSARACLVVIGGGCLTCLAAVGASAIAMRPLTGSGQSSAEVLLFGVLFLVAFGVDYLVFLVDGIRRAAPGPREQRITEGLASTGPVITSAGAVLAATFAVLLLVPEASVRQVGLLVAIGVLIDTLVVRTLLVPHLLAWVGGDWDGEANRGPRWRRTSWR